MTVRALRTAIGVFVVMGMLASMAMAEEKAKAGLALGDAVPMTSYTMKNVDGNSISLAEKVGKKGMLVVFTCNHCPYAMAWEDRIVKLGNEYLQKGIGVIAVNSNDPSIAEGDNYAAMQERAKQKQMAFPYVVDEGSKLATGFGATRTPEAFLFNAAGKLVYHGTIDDNHEDAAKVSKNYLRDALRDVSEGKPVATAETKAVGCSIKVKKA